MATIKLETITTDYRSFVPDQVLTAEQLNTVFNYLDDQNRLTRICLSGVGIVCGLEVSIRSNRITVTEGCGVTTDGDLVKFEKEIYTHYVPFEDEDAKYTKFKRFEAIEELITSDSEDATNNNLLSTLDGLENKVVVLYLENYAKDQTPCTSVDCDTQGQEQIAKIRMLLLDKTEVKALNESDAVFTKHDVLETYLGLPHIPVKRVVLTPTNAEDYTLLMGNYVTSVKNNPSPLSKLETGLTSLFTGFDLLLQPKSAARKLREILQRLNDIFTISSKNIPLDIQQRYTFLKDIIGTYEEIKMLLFDLRYSCCSSETSFPKHLLLGELFPSKEYLTCRHSFYPSRIIPHANERLVEINNLLDKIYYMAREYSVEPVELIKITPSKQAIHKLSERAIPYYYRTTNNLLEFWDYQKTKQFIPDRNLGYQSSNLSGDDAIQNPLDYCMDPNDFYRIEGHLGMDFFEALKAINTIKAEKGLAFDVKVLSINETLESIDESKYQCHFEDLNTILLAFLKEQECLYKDITDFFSAFSTKEPGTNKRYKIQVETEGTTERVITEAEVEVPIETAPITRTTRSGTRDLGINEIESRNFGTRSFGIGGLESKSFGTVGFDKQTFGTRTFGTKSTERIIPLKYEPLEVVEQNIYKEEGAIGIIIKDVIDKNPDREASTLIREIEDQVKLIEEIKELDEDVKAVAITFPYELVVYSRTASRLIPTTMGELNEVRLDQFNQSGKELCEIVDRYQKAMTKALYGKDTAYKRQGFESRLELLLNQLAINCCAAEKIKVLMDDIKKRKLDILLQKTLASFVKKHPGLEHKAGVRPGGTFVMVYMGNNEEPVLTEKGFRREDILRDLNLTTGGANIFTRESKVNLEKIPVRGRTVPIKERVVAEGRNPIGTRNFGLTIEKGSIGKFTERELGLLLGGVRNPSANIPQNTVVADFSLPYLCCSDCAPINFIIPAQPVSLRLSKAHICLDKETKPLLFEVVPRDGEVTADVAEGLSGGVTKNNDDKYVFDASLVSESLYGEEIKFMVNGQFTDATIFVFEKPQFDFSFSDPKYSKDGFSAEVTFTTRGDDLPRGVTYEWNFGDGSTGLNRFVENPRHIYDLRGQTDEVVTFTVVLTIANGRCQESQTHDIELEIVFPELDIPDEVCFDNSEEQPMEIPYTVVPEGALVELVPDQDISNIEINPDSIILGAEFRTFDTPVLFMVDKREVTQQLIVRFRPRLTIRVSERDLFFDEKDRAEIKFKILNQTNFDERFYKYAWDFGDGKTSRTLEPTHTFAAPKETEPGATVTFNTVLTLIGGPCTELTFPIELNIVKRGGQ